MDQMMTRPSSAPVAIYRLSGENARSLIPARGRNEPFVSLAVSEIGFKQ
jgi:hypothetical protein